MTFFLHLCHLSFSGILCWLFFFSQVLISSVMGDQKFVFDIKTGYFSAIIAILVHIASKLSLVARQRIRREKRQVMVAVKADNR